MWPDPRWLMSLQTLPHKERNVLRPPDALLQERKALLRNSTDTWWGQNEDVNTWIVQFEEVLATAFKGNLKERFRGRDQVRSAVRQSILLSPGGQPDSEASQTWWDGKCTTASLGQPSVLKTLTCVRSPDLRSTYRKFWVEMNKQGLTRQ